MGRKLGAAEAAQLGLVSMVVPHAEFEQKAWKVNHGRGRRCCMRRENVVESSIENA